LKDKKLADSKKYQLKKKINITKKNKKRKTTKASMNINKG